MNVSLNTANSITLVINNAVRVVKAVYVRNSELLDSNSAEASARHQLSENASQARQFTNVERGVMIRKGEPIPVGKMNQLLTTPPGVLEIIVSARTGEILNKENIAQYNTDH